MLIISFILQYLLTTAESALVDLYQFGLIQNTTPDRDIASEIRRAIKDVCTDILPHAIALTDSFGFSDWELDR